MCPAFIVDSCFTVGSSSDPAGITMFDSVKVYVKTKEAFGWPEEPDEFPEPSVPSKVTPPSGGIAMAAESDAAPSQPIPMTNADRWDRMFLALVCMEIQSCMTGAIVYSQLQVVYRGFPTRMVYLYSISCLRYTILVGNPVIDFQHIVIDIRHSFFIFFLRGLE